MNTTNKPNEIYITPESWGSETYYFLEEALPEFIKGMTLSFNCDEGDLEPPEVLTLNENGLYESIFYKNIGRFNYSLIDSSDPSDLKVQELGPA